MATLGMRHAVLWVTDPEVSADFYAEALGLEVTNSFDGGIFMTSPNSFQNDWNLSGSSSASFCSPGWSLSWPGC